MQSNEQSAGNLQEKVIEYVARSHSKKGTIPSISQILKEVGTYRSLLYGIFPGGLGGICASAGVPEPTTRIERTANLSKIDRKDSGWLNKCLDNEKIARKGDPKALVEYINEILLYLPQLRKKFEALCSIYNVSKEKVILDAVTTAFPYLKVKRACQIQGRKAPTIKDFAIQVLEKWMSRCHQHYGPVIRRNICSEHKREMYLVKKGDSQFVICEDPSGLLIEHGLTCYLCQCEMKNIMLGVLFRCGSCGFLIKFDPRLQHREVQMYYQPVLPENQYEASQRQLDEEVVMMHQEFELYKKEVALAMIRDKRADLKRESEQIEAKRRRERGLNQRSVSLDPKAEEKLRNMDPIERKSTLRIAELLQTGMTVEELTISSWGGKHSKDAYEMWQRRVLGGTMKELEERDRRTIGKVDSD